MTVDVLIGYSACPITRAAFQKAGCQVWTCDLLPARDGDTEHHIQGDVWEALRSRAWSFAVLHPMCTYLTISAAWAYGDGPYHQRVRPETLTGRARCAARNDALLNFHRLLQLPFPVAVENPASSFINRTIRPPDQVIHPWQFGDDASKATGLWLTRGAPPLQTTRYYPPRLVCDNGHVFKHGLHRCPECSSERYLPRWSNQTNSGQNRLTPGDERWLERSKTYPGIAAAMGDQWGRWLFNRTITLPR